MDEALNERLARLENYIRVLQEQVEYWKDPAVIALAGTLGLKKTPKEFVGDLEKMIEKIRQHIKTISK